MDGQQGKSVYLEMVWEIWAGCKPQTSTIWDLWVRYTPVSKDIVKTREAERAGCTDGRATSPAWRSDVIICKNNKGSARTSFWCVRINCAYDVHVLHTSNTSTCQKHRLLAPEHYGINNNTIDIFQCTICVKNVCWRFCQVQGYAESTESIPATMRSCKHSAVRAMFCASTWKSTQYEWS